VNPPPEFPTRRRPDSIPGILFLVRYRNPLSYGGIPRKILLIAGWLKHHGILAPHLLTNMETPFSRDFVALGGQVHYLAMCGLLALPAIRRTARAIISRHSVRLVQTHDFWSSIAGRYVRRDQPGVPHVFRVHTHIEGTEVPNYRKIAYHLLDRHTERFVDYFVPISECVGRELEDFSGVPTDKIMVVHNGIPPPGQPDPLAKSGDEFLVREFAVVGEIEERKQQHMAVRAVARLRDKGMRVRLHIVGDGNEDYLAQICHDAKRLGVAELVVFHGYEPRPFERLKEVPVIVLPSRFEGVPTSLLEGMALRKLVVGTPTGGTAELVEDGVNGFMHPPGDVEGLANVLLRIFSRPAAEWETFRNAGYATWHGRFSMDVMMNGLAGVYRNLGVLV
jgi:glycosyltransferase involved in cell wall biosynthesis